mgnify:CR=1 FL=1
MMTEEEQKALDDALFRLAIGATVEEIGKDENGTTKVFKRKLAPNLDAIKYIESRRKPGKPRPAAWSPALPKTENESSGG